MAQASSNQSTDDRSRLLAHFSGNTADEPDRWSKLWDKGDFLPWDRGTPNPALVDLLSLQHAHSIGPALIDEDGSKRRRKALVPGCGRGYDVLLLASFGFDACGLEVSESAVRMCRQEQEDNGHKYPAKDDSNGAGKVEYVNGDFFDQLWARNRFDLIYDYTFLCALPPSLRPSWSLRMRQLLDPNGLLVCVEFPTYKDPSTGGPPHGLTPQTYIEHLGHPGKEVPYDGSGHVVTDGIKEEDPDALERIAHYQPNRTHKIGEGTDWISIWRHRGSNGAPIL